MTQSKERSKIRHILCDELSKPLPIYTHATVHHGIAYISCIQGFRPGSLEIPSDPYEQSKQVLHNLKIAVEKAGSNMSHVLKLTIFMTNMQEFQRINDAVNEFFPENPPARSSIAVAELPKNAKVVMEAIAAVVEETAHADF